MRRLCAVLVMLVVWPAWADYQDGLDAWQRSDYAMAVKELRQLAEQGDASAQYNLGLMYDNGTGVPQDYAEAARLYRLAADQGHTSAQYNLGLMYTKGTGVPQDYAEAAMLYRLAADQGDDWAQNNLGFMYDNGYGVPQDYDEAVKWYRLAADQGYAAAQNNLGFMYDNGYGVPQDYAEAMRWYRLAADQGNADAQNNLDQRDRKGFSIASMIASSLPLLLLVAFSLAILSVARNFRSDRTYSRNNFAIMFLIAGLPTFVITASDLNLWINGERFGVSNFLMQFNYVYFAFVAYPFYQRVCWRVNDAGAGKLTAYICLVPYLNLLSFIYLCVARTRPTRSQ